MVEFLPQGTTINSAVYCETLQKLRRAIQNKRCGMLSVVNDFVKEFQFTFFFLIITFCKADVIGLDSCVRQNTSFPLFTEQTVRLYDQHFKKCRTGELCSRLAARG